MEKLRKNPLHVWYIRSSLVFGIWGLGFDLGIRYSQYFQTRNISWACKTTITPKQIEKQKFYPK